LNEEKIILTFLYAQLYIIPMTFLNKYTLLINKDSDQWCLVLTLESRENQIWAIHFYLRLICIHVCNIIRLIYMLLWYLFSIRFNTCTMTSFATNTSTVKNDKMKWKLKRIISLYFRLLQIILCEKIEIIENYEWQRESNLHSHVIFLFRWIINQCFIEWVGNWQRQLQKTNYSITSHPIYVEIVAFLVFVQWYKS
jgi:hypothetical protein